MLGSFILELKNTLPMGIHVVTAWTWHVPQTSVETVHQLAGTWFPASIANGSTMGPALPGSQLFDPDSDRATGSGCNSFPNSWLKVCKKQE
ncbi:hypothetical protein B0H10DRAFT_2021795 [Mycena sp. CBHHK59/15]|nr:hypothetical protein B0H10DRAFT_2021795 [Mycena sp. CBHHK59/15]